MFSNFINTEHVDCCFIRDIHKTGKYFSCKAQMHITGTQICAPSVATNKISLYKICIHFSSPNLYSYFQNDSNLEFIKENSSTRVSRNNKLKTYYNLEITFEIWHNKFNRITLSNKFRIITTIKRQMNQCREDLFSAYLSC